MATDPFVAPTLADKPRTDRNMSSGVGVAPAGGWRADRPGDLAGRQPEGALLGRPGPNVGYALTLCARVSDRFALAPGEHHEDAVAVVAELAMRRAAAFGRGPVVADVEHAATLLGYLGGAAPDATARRAHAVHHAAHDYPTRRRVVESFSDDEVRATPGPR
ncbi:MAG: hypothetical protein U0V73_06500 [Acidimicrobiia bacterium]